MSPRTGPPREGFELSTRWSCAYSWPVPTALLVRHGRTTANTSGVLAGWTPGVELDDRGRAQVTALAARLVGIGVSRIVSSPLTRCLQTSDILQAALSAAGESVTVDEDDDLGECRYGAWTGRALAELASEPLWRVVQDHPSAARFPYSPDHASESIAEMSARAVSTVRRLDAAVGVDHGEQSVWVAVSHGDIVKAVIADAAGTHLDNFQRYVVDPASISAVRYTPARPFLLRVNDTGEDLAALRPTPHEHVPVGDSAVGGGAGHAG
jgi:probable phosphomutase (TIGR03848 family)